MLPRLLVLTDRRQVPTGRDLVDVVGDAVASGARAVLLRERDLPPPARQRLAADLRELLRPVDGVLLAASPPVGPADGVHLRAADPMPGGPRPALVGRSCHDATELATATDEGCDYVTLSPVAPSRSKPGYGPALGADRFGALATRTPLPVYALGGVTPDDTGRWRRAGAYGVAVMGPIMRADDPAATTAAYLDAMGAPTR
jgi:thiamine-phosphate diphosphorylase